MGRIPVALAAELELALLAAELEQQAAEEAAGYALPGARRPFPHELRARVRFAELDRLLEQASQLAARKADRVRLALIDHLADLAGEAATTDDPFEVLRRLQQLADPLTGSAQLAAVDAIVAEVTDELTADLTALANQAGRQVLAEAAAQGLPVAALPAGGSFTTELTDQAIRAAAQRAAQAPVARLLGVAVEAGNRASLRPGAAGADVAFEALDAAESASTAGTEDLARQAATIAHGAGRGTAAALAPEPREVYASELLDRNTCGPCGHVDGRRYDTLAHALEDYPGAGGFVFCDGGARCRGTLVYVWSSEAEPTDGPSGPAQGPSDPPHGPDGPLRPIRPDDRTSFPSVGRPPLPPAPNPPTAPPITIGPDPDADEGWYTGEDLTPEEEAAQLARIAAGMEETAPAISELGLGNSRGGRRIDRVREDYQAEQYRRMIEAEHVAGIRADRVEEFRAKYGGPDAYEEVLWNGPAHQAYYYASEELRLWWDTHPRLSFAEYAEAAGIRDAKTLGRAQAARAAREKASRLAQESGTGRDLERKRAIDAERRRRRDNSPGAQLERQRRRLELEQRRAAKAAEELERAGVIREDLPPVASPPTPPDSGTHP